MFETIILWPDHSLKPLEKINEEIAVLGNRRNFVGFVKIPSFPLTYMQKKKKKKKNFPMVQG